jgi:hypothetical protein
MTDEREIAALLGEAPGPDTRFRLNVLAMVGAEKRRRAAMRRAVVRAGVFTLVGLVAAGVQAAGVSQAAAAPLTMIVAALGVAYLCAALALQSPSALMARASAAFRISA